MSGPLNHTPAEILRQLMIDLALCTDVEDELAWPCYHTQHPESPDASLAVYDTDGRLQGRTHTDGETQEHYGVQIRVRSNDDEVTFSKAKSIAVALDGVARREVELGSSIYLVQAVNRVGGLIPAGDSGNRRRVYTINLLIGLRFQE